MHTARTKNIQEIWCTFPFESLSKAAQKLVSPSKFWHIGTLQDTQVQPSTKKGERREKPWKQARAEDSGELTVSPSVSGTFKYVHFLSEPSGEFFK